MPNRDTEAAWTYHDATKHSYWSVRADTHRLDWANQPLPFKIYPTPELLPLPREVPQSGIAALSALQQPAVPPHGEVVPDLATLAQLLFFSTGVTRRRTYPGGETFFPAPALDTGREVAFSLVPIGYQESLPPGPAAEVVPLSLEVVPYSQREVDYPAMREMHAASSLHSPEEVVAWRGQTSALEVPPTAGATVRLEPLGSGETPRDPIEQGIL